MGLSMLANSPMAKAYIAEPGDAFRFLAFNYTSGEILSHGGRAILALAEADQLEPHEAIQVLNAGVAGKSLWDNQTSLPLAKVIIDNLQDPWSKEPQLPGSTFGVS